MCIPVYSYFLHIFQCICCTIYPQSCTIYPQTQRWQRSNCHIFLSPTQAGVPVHDSLLFRYSTPWEKRIIPLLSSSQLYLSPHLKNDCLESDFLLAKLKFSMPVLFSFFLYSLVFGNTHMNIPICRCKQKYPHPNHSRIFLPTRILIKQYLYNTYLAAKKSLKVRLFGCNLTINSIFRPCQVFC